MSHVAEQSSWVSLPYCSPPGCPFPIKSLALSAHVSPRIIHFRVLDKSPVSGPGRGPPSCNTTNEYSGLISFRINWLGLLAVQETLKSLFQNHSSKASILQDSAFFIVQLLYPYMTTGKTIALTRRTLVCKVMSLLLNILSRLVITFLPRSKRLLISWLQITSPPKLLQEGGPLPGPKTGLLSNTQK